MKVIIPTPVIDPTLTRASVATYYDYAGTLRTAAVDVLRVTYNPALLTEVPHILTEAVATNLLTYSEQLDNAAWTKTRATISANATAAPDGATTADKLIEDNTVTSTHMVSHTATITTATYTWSVYAKASTRTWLAISANDGSAHITYFNLGTGAVGTNAAGNTAVIQALPGGWYRCSVSRLSAGTSGIIECYLATADGTISYSGDNASGLYLWGAQIELGATASSYVQAVAATATRAVDTYTRTDGALAYSSVVENDYTAWNIATAYVATDRVLRLHVVYECLIANTGVAPETNNNENTSTNPKWLVVRPSNRWAAYDESPSTITSVASPLIMTVTPGRADGLAILSASGTSARISIYSPSSGGTIFDRTISLVTTEYAVSDWFAFFYAPIERIENIVITDLPLVNDAQVTVTITDPTINAAAGVVIFGLTQDLGKPQYGMQIGITSFSKKTTDSFGYVQLLRRGFIQRESMNVYVENGAVTTTLKKLKRLMDVNTVWIPAGNKYEGTVLYGYYKDWNFVLGYPTYSLYDLSLESLI